MFADLMSSLDIRVVVDRPYDAPVPEFFDFLNENVLATVRRYPKVYLFGTFLKFGPIFWKQTTGANTDKYVVASNDGGPSLVLSLARETSTGDVGWGVLSYAREYRNPHTEEWERPSEDLKRAFDEVQKIMRRHLKRHKLKNSFWIGVDALQRFEAGELKITAKGVV
jgi:hypothetical protein